MAIYMSDVTAVVAGKLIRIASKFIADKVLKKPEVGNLVTIGLGAGAAMFGPNYFPQFRRQLEVGGVVAMVDAAEDLLRQRGWLTYGAEEGNIEVFALPAETSEEEVIEIA